MNREELNLILFFLKKTIKLRVVLKWLETTKSYF